MSFIFRNYYKRSLVYFFMLKEMIKIARGAGEVLMKFHNKKISSELKEGVRGNIVTEADLASDKFIREKTKELLPDVKLITEEMDVKLTQMSGMVLIADPLDGTTCFVNGNTGKYDDFCVILGLCENAKPIIGVVYDHLNDRLYYAQKGEGAFLEEKGEKIKLKVSEQTSLKKSILLLRDLKNVGKNDEFDKGLDKLDVKEKHEGGGYAIKAMAIAKGKVSVYIHGSKGFTMGRWDTCGVEIIVEEAGGFVSDFSFKRLDYSKPDSSFTKKAVITTNYHINKELRNALRGL